MSFEGEKKRVTQVCFQLRGTVQAPMASLASWPTTHHSPCLLTRGKFWICRCITKARASSFQSQTTPGTWGPMENPVPSALPSQPPACLPPLWPHVIPEWVSLWAFFLLDYPVMGWGSRPKGSFCHGEPDPTSFVPWGSPDGKGLKPKTGR
jgi:hypothetical protein